MGSLAIMKKIYQNVCKLLFHLIIILYEVIVKKV